MKIVKIFFFLSKEAALVHKAVMTELWKLPVHEISGKGISISQALLGADASISTSVCRSACKS